MGKSLDKSFRCFKDILVNFMVLGVFESFRVFDYIYIYIYTYTYNKWVIE